jgi:uncharacterized protein (UPF0332 family)
MTISRRIANPSEERQRGEETLRAGDELLRLGLYNDSVSRATYAAYHWAKSVTIQAGLKAKTHRGVSQRLGMHFIKTQRLPAEAAQLLAKLEARRKPSDYSATVRFTAEDAAESLKQARDFIALCQTLNPAE